MSALERFFLREAEAAKKKAAASSDGKVAKPVPPKLSPAATDALHLFKSWGFKDKVSEDGQWMELVLGPVLFRVPSVLAPSGSRIEGEGDGMKGKVTGRNAVEAVHLLSRAAVAQKSMSVHAKLAKVVDKAAKFATQWRAKQEELQAEKAGV